MENTFELKDLINNAVTQKPVEFGDAFNDMIMDKLSTAIQNKKIEIAKRIYNVTSDEIENSDVEDTENNG